MEISRDIFGAAYSPLIFAKKAQTSNVIIGGYGGELLRDKYSRFKSLGDMVKSSYINAGMRLSRAATFDYINALESKFDQIGKADIKTAVETVYYLEKMRYWGGSRITALNQYCFHVHTLLDDALAKYALGFSLEDKKDAQLQKRIITESCEALARVRSSYFDKPMYFKNGDDGLSKSNRFLLKLRRTKYAVRKLSNIAKNTAFFSSSKPRLYQSVFSSKGRLAEILNIEPKNIYNIKILGRYLTLEKTLDKFKDRI